MSLIYTTSSESNNRGGKRCHRLYIGGRSDAKNRDKLLQWGITHILNVTPTKDAGVQVCLQNICATNTVKKHTHTSAVVGLFLFFLLVDTPYTILELDV